MLVLKVKGDERLFLSTEVDGKQVVLADIYIDGPRERNHKLFIKVDPTVKVTRGVTVGKQYPENKTAADGELAAGRNWEVRTDRTTDQDFRSHGHRNVQGSD